MPIVEFSNLNRYGNVRTRRFWKDKSNLNVNPNGLGPSISYNLFKYEYRHPITPPGLVRLGNKKFITPTWQEVLPETRLEDIKWVKPKTKKPKKEETIIETHTSSSNANKTYKTMYYPESGNFRCSCPGSWRAADRRCKHIKALEKKVL